MKLVHLTLLLIASFALISCVEVKVEEPYQVQPKVVHDEQQVIEVEEKEPEPAPLPLPEPQAIPTPPPIEPEPVVEESVQEEVVLNEPVVIEPTVPTAEPIIIDVLAKSDGFIPAEINLVRKQPYQLHFTSTDEDHAIQILPLGVTYYEIPLGTTAVIDYTPKTKGNFPIICLKNCGTGSQQIKGRIIVK